MSGLCPRNRTESVDDAVQVHPPQAAAEEPASRDLRPRRPVQRVHVPTGGVHGFRNDSAAPALMLLHFAPGAPREAYFEGLSVLADMTDDERVAFFLEHDNRWV